MTGNYYLMRKTELLADFDVEAPAIRRVLCRRYGSQLAQIFLVEARAAFDELIATIPYIGGDENVFTAGLICSVRCLALYQVMRARGHRVAEVGRVLWDAAPSIATAQPPAASGTAPRLSADELMARRRVRAARSQLRQYPDDYVFSLVEGDGERFDYGYEFTECATAKFYHAQGADEFLPFFCFLDYAISRVAGQGLERTMTLAEGAKCDHRFKRGRATEPCWPPPFMREGRRP